MRKLGPVEEAKALLQEAKDWGTWKWLTDKKRVRSTADKAWAALEEVEAEIKASWADDLRKAYRACQGVDGNAREVPAEVRALAKKLWKEDDEALQARMGAEETFDQAERQMSVSLARQGSEQAIDAYERREEFLRKAAAAPRK